MPGLRKILTIDGGGIKGVFPASFLASIEENIGRPLWEFFDLIAGTSTGGIIALGLGLGIPAKDIKKFYLEQGPYIFSTPNRRFIKRLWSSKYSPGELKNALKKTFGDKLLGESNTRLVIPAVSAYTNRVYVYKTRHHPRFENDYKVPMVDVAMATSAAPTYFPPHLCNNGQLLVDGGIWANNPLGMAAVESTMVLNWPRDQIFAVSIGCTSTPVEPDYPGFLRAFKLARYVTDLFMTGQAHASMGTAALILGSQNIMRINPIVPRGRFSLDSVGRSQELAARAEEEAREAIPNLRNYVFDRPAEKFEPY